MRKTIISGLLLLAAFEGFAQTGRLSLSSDNSGFFITTEKEQLKYADSLYVVKTGCGRDFIDGRIYIRYFSLSDHIPLLFPDRERTASLIYRGRIYDNIVLQYDTYLDLLIYDDKGTGSTDPGTRVALNSNNISRFTLCFSNDTLTFRYFSRRLDPGFNLEPGFYESVYDGVCKYLVRHRSTRVNHNGIYEYIYDPSGYVRVGEKFVRIKSPGQFASLFGNRSKEIRKLINEKRIKIRGADKHQIADILRFYESTGTNSR